MNGKVSAIQAVFDELWAREEPERAKRDLRFFQCVAGGYGNPNDKFCGAAVAEIRAIAKRYFAVLNEQELESLLKCPLHEARFAALAMLELRYKKADKPRRDAIAEFFVANFDAVDNWDLVDLSAPNILGRNCYENGDFSRLFAFAKSGELWKERAAIVGNWHAIRRGTYEPILKISKRLLRHKHGLIHKAIGWMLREMGRNSLEGREELVAFLDAFGSEMSRTTLRYAIERFSPPMRAEYLRNTKK